VRPRVIAAASVLALALALGCSSGCSAILTRPSARTPRAVAAGVETTGEAGRYFMDATAVPPPEAPRVMQSAHALALVRRYVDDARLGRREQLIKAYDPDTRRSAQTVVARDLELARPGGPLYRNVGAYLSVALEEGRLWPPQSAELVTAEDAERLEALAGTHDDAFIVLIRFTDDTTRPLFVVRDGTDWWLLP